MGAYIQIMKDTWAEYMTYRLNFMMWRVRMVMQILVIYFLWWAIFSTQKHFFGYNQSMILTYVLLMSVVRTIALSTTTLEIGDIINQGNLSNFLVRPINFFSYYAARDTADKALNIGCSLVELSFLFLLLRPPIFLQTNPAYIILTLFAVAIGTVLYFFFSLLMGLLGFWTPDFWSVRFLAFITVDFFAGGLFPLDILPKPLYIVSQSLPFLYFVYFPLKIYLGQLTALQIVRGCVVGVLWVVGMAGGAVLLWKKGLKVYTAEGK